MSEPGILHPTVARRRFDYQRHVPDAQLAPFVENFWTVTWDLSSSEPFTAQVLAYPSVNCSVTHEDAAVTGLTRRRYDRRLVGRGHVVGARFRPGCFRPWVDHPVSHLTDTSAPLNEVLGRDTRALQHSVGATEDLAERVALLSAFLLEDPPAPDPVSATVAALVAEAAARPDLIRVRQLATLAGMSERRLHRLFVVYVGAGPKWVISRCRLHDVAARAADDPGVDLSQLALDLGFADQAHLTRAFSSVVGTPPAAYAAGLRTTS